MVSRASDERRCGGCEQRLAPLKSTQLLGVPVSHQYGCERCGGGFSIATAWGWVVGVALPLGIAAAIWLAPPSRFGSSRDQFWLRVISAVQLLAPVALLRASHRNARENPPAG